MQGQVNVIIPIAFTFIKYRNVNYCSAFKQRNEITKKKCRLHSENVFSVQIIIFESLVIDTQNLYDLCVYEFSFS